MAGQRAKKGPSWAARLLLDAAYKVSIAILLSLAITKLATGHATVFGFTIIKVVSGSMEPTIMTGQRVVGVMAGHRKLSPGDVATYLQVKEDGEPTGAEIIHRVYDVLPNGDYVFWGDNNEKPDRRPVRQGQIMFYVIGYSDPGKRPLP